MRIHRLVLLIVICALVLASAGCAAATDAALTNTGPQIINYATVMSNPAMTQAVAAFDAALKSGGNFRVLQLGEEFIFVFNHNGSVMLINVFKENSKTMTQLLPLLRDSNEEQVVNLIRSNGFVELAKANWPTFIVTAAQTSQTLVAFLTSISNAELVPLIVPVTPGMFPFMEEPPIT